MHPRTEILAAVELALKGNTSAADRVFSTRVVDYIPGDITPIIAIYINSEDSKVGDNSPREYDRVGALYIECIVKAPTGPELELAMNDLAKEIEDRMNVDYTFGRKLYDSELNSTVLDVQDDGGDDAGILEMTYSLKYRTDAWVEPTGDDATGDFLRNKTTINLGGNQADADTTGDEFDQEPTP